MTITTTFNINNNKNRIYHDLGFFKNYKKMSAPRHSKEVKIFVDNMMSYINEHEFDSTLLILKIKLQTRYNDFKNKALEFDYFKESLVKMQRELVSRICMVSDGEKKIEEVAYELMSKKRTRTDSKSDEQSDVNNTNNNTCYDISDSSESNSFGLSSCSNKTPNSAKSKKKQLKQRKINLK